MDTQKKMRFLPSVSLTVAMKGFGLVLTTFSAIISARYLGPSGKGILAVLTILMGLFVQFGNLGFHSSNTYFAAKKPSQAGKICGNSLWVSIIMSLLFVGTSPLWIGAASKFWGEVPRLFIYVFILSAPFQLMGLLASNLLLGLDRIVSYNMFEFILRLGYLILFVILLVIMDMGVYEVVVGLTAVTALIGTGYIIFLFTIGAGGFSFHWALFKETFKYGRKIYFATFLAFLTIRFNLLLVNYFLGANEAGFYSIAVQCADLIYIIPVSVGTMLFPRVSSQEKDPGEFTWRVSRHTTFIMIIICATAALLSKIVIRILFGEVFLPSVNLFLALVPGIFFLSLETLYMNDLAGRGLPPVTYITPAIGLVLNMALNIILIPKIGTIGASAASSVTYFIMFLILEEYLRRRLKRRFIDLFLLRPGELWMTIRKTRIKGVNI